MTTTPKRGVLVAVANPEGVAPLMAIALAASGHDPNRLTGARASTGVAKCRSAGLNKGTTALLSALTAAIGTLARRDDQGANDAFRRSRPRHRPRPRGTRWRGSLGIIVRLPAATRWASRARSVHRIENGPINVGAFIRGDRPFERVFAAIDPGPDGRAASTSARASRATIDRGCARC